MGDAARTEMTFFGAGAMVNNPFIPNLTFVYTGEAICNTIEDAVESTNGYYGDLLSFCDLDMSLESVNSIIDGWQEGFDLILNLNDTWSVYSGALDLVINPPSSEDCECAILLNDGTWSEFSTANAPPNGDCLSTSIFSGLWCRRFTPASITYTYHESDGVVNASSAMGFPGVPEEGLLIMPGATHHSMRNHPTTKDALNFVWDQPLTSASNFFRTPER